MYWTENFHPNPSFRSREIYRVMSIPVSIAQSFFFFNGNMTNKTRFTTTIKQCD